MIELISQPWPWYLSGPLIAVVMLLLLVFGGEFGVSGSLRSLCAIGGAGKKVAFFDYNWRDRIWNLVFVFGSIIGGFIAYEFLGSEAPLALSEKTIKDLATLGVSFDGGLAPQTLFSWSSLSKPKVLFILIVGGFLVGFGTRWAGGCTSGHAISGLSNLQLPSLIAVIGFFLGGLIMTHLLFPLIF